MFCLGLDDLLGSGSSAGNLRQHGRVEALAMFCLGLDDLVLLCRGGGNLGQDVTLEGPAVAHLSCRCLINLSSSRRDRPQHSHVCLTHSVLGL